MNPVPLVHPRGVANVRWRSQLPESAVRSAVPVIRGAACRARWLSSGRASGVALLLCSMVLLPLALADEHSEERRSPDETASIGALLERVAREFPGQVLKVELESDDDAASDWGYEVKVLTTSGHVLEVKMDAVSLEPYEIEGLSEWRAGDD